MIEDFRNLKSMLELEQRLEEMINYSTVHENNLFLFSVDPSFIGVVTGDLRLLLTIKEAHLLLK